MLWRLLMPVAKLCLAILCIEAWPALPFRRCKGLRSSLVTSDVASTLPAQSESTQSDTLGRLTLVQCTGTPSCIPYSRYSISNWRGANVVYPYRNYKG